MRNDADSFLAEVLPLMQSADVALHDGDPGPRAAMWSRGEPVTLFGAAFTASGQDAVRAVFERLADQFSDCRSFEIEVVAADAGAELGYVVAIERTTASIGGRDPAPYSLRVTTILRREAGEWRVVHRHGDPYDESASGLVAQLRGDCASPGANREAPR